MDYIYFIIFYNFLLLFSRMYSIKPKLCANCKFCIKDFFEISNKGKCSLFPKAEKEEQSRFFLVDEGILIKKTDYQYCNISREYQNMCGKDGKLYEEKDEI